MASQSFFRDNSDATKKVNFDPAAVSTGTTRTITMPDADVDLGALATVVYVNQVAAASTWKQSCTAATTASVTLSSLTAGSSLDGVPLVAGMRVLVKDQSSGTENGIYVIASSGAPARAEDFDEDQDVVQGAATYIQAGATNGDKVFLMTNDGPIIIGTDAPVFAELSGGSGPGTTYTGQPGVVFVNGTVIELVDDVTPKTPAANAAIDWDVTADGLFLDITLDGNNTLNLPTNLPAAGTYRSAAVKVTKTNSTDTLTLNGYFDGDATFEGTGPFLCSVVLENGSAIWRSESGLATDSNAGFVELATDAETIAGTDDQRAVTPSNLDARDVQIIGITSGEADMGAFTGTTIGDDQSVKACLQDLETAVENAVQIPTVPEDYTVTNMTSLRSLDCDAATLQNTNDVLGQLINDLITIGILQ